MLGYRLRRALWLILTLILKIAAMILIMTLILKMEAKGKGRAPEGSTLGCRSRTWGCIGRKGGPMPHR